MRRDQIIGGIGGSAPVGVNWPLLLPLFPPDTPTDSPWIYIVKAKENLQKFRVMSEKHPRDEQEPPSSARPHGLKKVKKSSTRLKHLKEFPELRADSLDFYFCSVCMVFLKPDKFELDQHFSGVRHVDKKSALEKTIPLPQFISKTSLHPSVKKTLLGFLGHGIGPYEASKIMFDKEFVESMEHSRHCWPSAQWLRKRYVPSVLQSVEDKMRDIVHQKCVCLASDETTDVKGRKVVAVALSTWDTQFIYDVYVFEDSVVDHKLISSLCFKSLEKLNVSSDRVIGFVSDNAPYMGAAYEAMKEKLQGITRVRCLSHGLNLTMKYFGSAFSDIHCLFGLLRKYLKRSETGKRRKRMKETLGKSSVQSLTVCLSRWTSWEKAVRYLHIHFDDVLHHFQSEVKQKQRRSDDILLLLTKPTTKISCGVVAELSAPWIEAVNASEGKNTFGIEQYMSLMNARKDLDRCSGEGGKVLCEFVARKAFSRDDGVEHAREVSTLLGRACEAAIKKI
jgi:hypothetical protein